MRIFLLLISCFLSFTVSLIAQSDGSIAFRVGTVITMDGRNYSPGTVVIERGVVTAVGGGDVEIPFDVILKEYPEATLFPGFSEAHTSSGLDRANENVPIAPFLNVKDSIDPVSFYFEDELRSGTTAIGVIPGANCVIGGLGRVVTPSGMTIEAMTLDDAMGMKVAIGPKSGWSRSAQLAEMREAIANLWKDLERKGQELLEAEALSADKERADEADKEGEDDGDMWDMTGGFVRYGDDFPGKELISEEDVDSTQRGLVRLLNGEERVWLWCPSATDVFHGKNWAYDLNLLDQVVFVITPSAWKAVDILKLSGRPVALTGGLWHVENDPITWKEVRTFVPTILHEAGVSFSIASDKSRMGPDKLSYQAASCVREGVPRDVALAAVTTIPALLWGMEDRSGAIKLGADGSLVVLDGDPLKMSSRVLEVWLRGVKAYDRATDARLQRMLEGRNR